METQKILILRTGEANIEIYCFPHVIYLCPETSLHISNYVFVLSKLQINLRSQENGKRLMVQFKELCVINK